MAAADDIDVVGYSVSWRGRGHGVDGLLPTGVRRARAADGGAAAAPAVAADRLAADRVVDRAGRPRARAELRRAAARSGGTVELATVHDLTCVRFPELCTRDTLQYPDLIRRALRRGAHVHAVSQFVADEVVEVFAVEPDRVHVVPNGIDPVQRGRCGRRAGRGPAPTATSSPSAPSSPARTCRCSSTRSTQLAAADADVRLVVAGQDGWGTRGVRRRRRTRPTTATGSCAPAGSTTATRADLLAGAAVFAYPSRYEGFGLPPLEAMAAGTPVVATRAGALPEVLGDGARFVAPGDVDDLAAALTLVLDDSGRTRASGRTPARTRARRYLVGRVR